MTRRFNFLSALVLTLLFGTMAFAQQKSIYDDEVVKDPDGQHKEWRAGNTKYPSKPRDMWELGLHAGILTISGDVNPWRPIPGYAFGLSLRKSLGYVFSVRLTGHYGVTCGVNFQPNQAGAYQNKQLRNVGPNNTGYGSQVRLNPNPNAADEVFRVGDGIPWFANYENKYLEASIQGIINLNNLKFHKERNKWNFYVFGGGGLNAYQLHYDALNGDQLYDAEFRQLASDIYGANPTYDRDTREGRREIREKLINDILDGDFETPGEVWGNLWNFTGTSDKDGANTVGKALANAGVGIGYHLGDRVTLSLEYQVTFSDDDLLDGYRWHDSGSTANSDVDFTRDVDVPHYKNLRLNFHLGSFDKAVEPLWWLNPLDAPYEQIARNARKKEGCPPDDEDGDGVLDCVDREPNTPPDCPVDTRGVTLDSDSDGVPDCQDREPYSPPGCPVDAEGVADCPKPPPPYSDDDVKRVGQEQGWYDVPDFPAYPEPCANEWYLPMVHFDLDKYYLKPEFYPQLHHVANTMLRCPGLQVVVTGHTDARLPNPYNDVLSYKRAEKVISYLTNNYGIDRSRLILQYGGEANPIVSQLGDNHTGKKEVEIGQYMNRRVEFRVARGESEQGRPAYSGNWDSVGKDTPKSSRSSNIYSGNPGAGY